MNAELQTESLSLSFRLTGSGWAAGEIRSGTNAAPFAASYLSDAFGCLVAAAADIQQGVESVRFSFDEEPGEYRWLLLRHDTSLTIQILWFDELWGQQPDSIGRPVFTAKIDARDFSLSVKRIADQLLDQLGLDGYFDQWVEAPFPINVYTRLCNALGMERHPACSIKMRKRPPRQAAMRSAD